MGKMSWLTIITMLQSIYYLKMPEDIAGVYYNKSLNYIMQGNYRRLSALLVA